MINNAGYGHFGFVEELSEAEARAQIETNLFGALWTTQAAIPLLRSQGGGHLLQVSSIGGVAAFPSLGIYHASKWALEGLTEALSAEVAMSHSHDADRARRLCHRLGRGVGATLDRAAPPISRSATR